MNSVLFLHGWAANHHIFDDFKRDFEHSKTPDLPGHGSAPFLGHFNSEDIADTFANEQKHPVHVLGWSLGGYIALIMAAKYPQKVKSLVIFSSFARYCKTDNYSIGIDRNKAMPMAQLFAQNFNHHMCQFINWHGFSGKNTDKSQKWIEKMTQYGTPPAIIQAHQAVLESDARHLLQNIQQKVCIINGKQDRITSPLMAEYLAQNIPNAQLHLLNKCAHLPFISNQEECLDIVKNFWSK